MFPRVKGVADNFLDTSHWTSVQKKIQDYLKRYNFQAIDIPLLEHVALFERGLGYETDVVSKQMFLIESKSESKQERLCLRPEATAGTMRAFLEQQSAHTLPLRVFTYGSMFRYERPQKGRLREFHQFNLELLGAASILYDVQMIKMLQVLFSEILELKNFILKINFLGQAQDRQKFCQALVATLTPLAQQLCEVCQQRLTTNPLRILDCKSTTCQQLAATAPQLHQFFSPETCQEWQLLQDSLQELAVSFVVDHQLVRGLDYYNKTVFEFVSVDLGAQNTFCGGGRYDSLAQQLGSKVSVPAMGCAIGMERLMMILAEQNINHQLPAAPLICIVPLEQEQHKLALHLADFLTHHGRCVEILLDDVKIKNKMKRAHDLHATFSIIIGQEEQQSNLVTIKNMTTGEQHQVSQSQLLSAL